MRIKPILFVSLSVLISCSPSAPKLSVAPAPVIEKIEDKDTDLEVFYPGVDILFVIDNSGSMSSHQQLLAANISRFVGNFTKIGTLDFHVGVLSTDMDGGFSKCCGRLIGNPIFVDRNTPNLNGVLAQNMMLGIDGSGSEKSFDPVISALSQPNVGGTNAGFFRPDAHLAVIFITDAEDQSATTADNLLRFLVALKGSPERVLAYGAVVPSNDTSRCQRDEPGRPPTKIEDFLSKVSNAGGGKNIMSLCAPDYGDKLAALGKDLLDRVAYLIYLNRPPDVRTIRVTYGTQIIPRDVNLGWTFDPRRNVLILGEKIVWSKQPAGTKIKVFYDAAVPR